MGLWVRNAHFYFEKLCRISYVYYHNQAITKIRQKLVKLHLAELSRMLPFHFDHLNIRKGGSRKCIDPYIKSPEKITRQMDFGNALDGKTAPCGSQNPSSALLPAGAGHPLDFTKKYQSRWRGLFRSLTPAGAVFFPYFPKGNY